MTSANEAELKPIYLRTLEGHHPTLSCAIWTRFRIPRLLKTPHLLLIRDIKLPAYRRGTAQASQAQRGTRTQRYTVQCTSC
jgi:hypothetical protein